VQPIPVQALVEFLSELLHAGGADRREASAVAEVLVWADARGRHPQGAVWVDVLLARLASGAIRSPSEMIVVHDTPSLVVLDADHGFGQVAGLRAVTIAMERAATTSVGVVAVRNSTHYGAAGHYADRVARGGMIGLSLTNAYPKVAPHGGMGPALGTNPIAFAVPVAGRPPILGDLSTGALAGSRVREAIAESRQLEPGMAIDASGMPTTDPYALEQGGVMLPAAGAKGYALGLLVEAITSVLAAGAVASEVSSVFDVSHPGDTSHAVIALQPPDAAYPERAASLVAQVLRTPSSPLGAVRLPGDAGHEQRERTETSGVALPPDTLSRVRSGAARVGVTVPAELR
jgi:LDH2 family malate/lactate/ureidoglycolate dehydrogenase